MSDVFSSLERIDSYVEYSSVSGSGLPDVRDITEACQLCGWALNGSVSLISHSSFTMTPLFSWYYSTPGGSLWKVMARQIWTAPVCEKPRNTHEHAHMCLTVAELFACLKYGDGFNAHCSPKSANTCSPKELKGEAHWSVKKSIGFFFHYTLSRCKALIWGKMDSSLICSSAVHTCLYVTCYTGSSAERSRRVVTKREREGEGVGGWQFSDFWFMVWLQSFHPAGARLYLPASCELFLTWPSDAASSGSFRSSSKRNAHLHIHTGRTAFRRTNTHKYTLTER